VDALGDRVKRLRARRIGETKAVLGAPQLDITSSTAKFGTQQPTPISVTAHL